MRNAAQLLSTENASKQVPHIFFYTQLKFTIGRCKDLNSKYHEVVKKKCAKVFGGFVQGRKGFAKLCSKPNKFIAGFCDRF
jgi:hypothetical protein